mgnify:CR=1 FL=1
MCPTAGFCVDLSRSVVAATYIYSYGVDIVIRAGETWQYNSGTVHCQEERFEIIGYMHVVRQQATMTFYVSSALILYGREASKASE